MADNPRDLIRAAQSAELQGDMERAVDCLKRAAELYQSAGNAPRALQLLRHARKLDGSRVDIAEAVNRLEWMPETLLARPQPGDDEDSRLAAELDRSLGEEPLPELVRRQRLIEDALREAGMRAGDDEDAPRDGKAWIIETEPAEDLQRLEAQLARVAASVDAAEVARAVGAGTLPTEAVRAALSADVELAGTGGAGVSPTEAVRTAAPADLVERHAARDEASTAPDAAPASEEGSADAAPRRRREKRLIERGPTRADAALDAWCSFCCRPRSEVGDLVAGPTGSFICAGCLSESVSLLADVTPVPLPARQRPVEAPGAFMALVGQAEAQALLERALKTGARCLLAIGPEGCGKSVWFQQLQRQERGVLASLSALEQAPTSQPLLLEDVDRMDAEAHASLAAFLSRHPRHTVVLSARGLCPDSRGPVLRNDSGALPVPTTAALAQAVRGTTIPVSLLEHVQVLLPLHAPSQAEFMEIARKRLALREPAVSLSEDVLGVFAAEAVRSPRGGHELHALLNRVPAGAWGLDTAAKPAAPRKGRRKGSP
jgi:hypothetical protein